MSVILWRIYELADVSPRPVHILSCWFVMSAILQRIREVEVQNIFILYLYIGLANQHDRIWKGGGIQNNLEMYRNLKGMQYTSPIQKKTVTGTVSRELRWLLLYIDGKLFAKAGEQPISLGNPGELFNHIPFRQIKSRDTYLFYLLLEYSGPISLWVRTYCIKL